MITLDEFTKELRDQYGPQTVIEESENGKTVAISDYDADSGKVYLFEKEGQVFSPKQIVVPEYFRNAKGFGIEIRFSHNAKIMAVMAELCFDRHGKVKNYPVLIYQKNRLGVFTELASCIVRYEEKGSNYGECMEISPSGSFVFVGADRKENDQTTVANGSIGGVYVYKRHPDYLKYDQLAIIRPPCPGITGFGETLEVVSEEQIIVYDKDENAYSYRYCKDKDLWKFQEHEAVSLAA